MEHQVVAQRDGQAAVLTCGACSAQGRFGDTAFEGMSDFLRQHKRCVGDGPFWDRR